MCHARVHTLLVQVNGGLEVVLGFSSQIMLLTGFLLLLLLQQQLLLLLGSFS